MSVVQTASAAGNTHPAMHLVLLFPVFSELDPLIALI
jgi:hypothetical protein